jgi:hypothetical protein
MYAFELTTILIADKTQRVRKQIVITIPVGRKQPTKSPIQTFHRRKKPNGSKTGDVQLLELRLLENLFVKLIFK